MAPDHHGGVGRSTAGLWAEVWQGEGGVLGGGGQVGLATLTEKVVVAVCDRGGGVERPGAVPLSKPPCEKRRPDPGDSCALLRRRNGRDASETEGSCRPNAREGRQTSI